MSKIRAGILQQASPIGVFDYAGYVASALVDQDWTNLSDTPGAWSITSGVPFFSADGVAQGDIDPLTFELSIGGAVVGPPAWLLIIAKYDDITNIGFDIKAQNTAGTSYLLAEVNGNEDDGADTNAERVESGGPDCMALNLYVPILNPTSSTIYFGAVARIADIANNQYAEGTQHLNDDTDGSSYGLFSSGPCTDVYAATDIDKLIFSIHDLGASGTTIVRTILWTTLPGNDNNNFNLVAAELGWLP